MWTDIANKEVNSSSFQFNFRVDPMILSAEWLWFLCIVLVFSSHLFLYHANFSAINLICNEHQQWNNRGQYIYQWVSVCCYSCCILISIFQEQSLIPFSSCWTQKYLNNFREGIFTFWEPSLCVDGALQRKAPNQCIPRICKATRTVYLRLLLWCSGVFLPAVISVLQFGNSMLYSSFKLSMQLENISPVWHAQFSFPSLT